MAGARMQVDQQFTQQVLDSEFNNQQWGLIMTAVEFEIHDPEDPEVASLVANTDNLPHIIPELDRVQHGAGQPATPSGGRSSGGLLGRLRNLLGGQSGGLTVDKQQYDAATALVEQYTDELETFLKEEGRWVELCASAASSQSVDDSTGTVEEDNNG